MEEFREFIVVSEATEVDRPEVEGTGDGGGDFWGLVWWWAPCKACEKVGLDSPMVFVGDDVVWDVGGAAAAGAGAGRVDGARPDEARGFVGGALVAVELLLRRRDPEDILPGRCADRNCQNA